MANLDRVAVEGRGENRRDVLNVEIKNVSAARSAATWGEEDSDAVPEHVFLQTTWQMAVSGLRRTLVAACFFGRNLRVYEVDYDEGLGDELLEAARTFWETHVVPRVPPRRAAGVTDESAEAHRGTGSRRFRLTASKE